MSHLLHIDSSLQGDRSVSREFTARAAAAWRAAHPDGTVTYRDLATEPPPHYTGDHHSARFLQSAEHSAEQAEAHQLSATLVGEVLAADTVIIGAPLYNFGAPSTLKSWVDHLVYSGLSIDPETQQGLLGGRDVLIFSSRGGSYRPGTPREGWDHVIPWLTHSLGYLGIEPEFIEIELTLAAVVPAMEPLKDAAAASRAAAYEAIDQRWRSQTQVA